MTPEVQARRALAAGLRAEALAILEGGLLGLLEREFGPVSVAGSVALDLMAWPDIDLYVRLEAGEAAKMHHLVPELAGQLERQGYGLARTTLNNEYVLPDPKFPDTPGLYGGFVFVSRASGRRWKLDFWGWQTGHYEQTRDRHLELRRRLQTADRDLILRLKRAEGYGKEFFSVDVYDFAIAEAGSTPEEFGQFLRHRREPQRKS